MPAPRRSPISSAKPTTLARCCWSVTIRDCTIFATELIGSGDVEAREGLNEKLPTSGLVVIDFAFDDWSELHDSAGRLERYVTPRLIGAASD